MLSIARCVNSANEWKPKTFGGLVCKLGRRSDFHLFACLIGVILNFDFQVEHKKTLFFLEQLVLKHRLHVETTGIKPMSGGIDFFYSKLNSARKLVDFLQTVLPCRLTFSSIFNDKNADLLNNV